MDTCQWNFACGLGLEFVLCLLATFCQFFALRTDQGNLVFILHNLSVECPYRVTLWYSSPVHELNFDLNIFGPCALNPGSRFFKGAKNFQGEEVNSYELSDRSFTSLTTSSVWYKYKSRQTDSSRPHWRQVSHLSPFASAETFIKLPSN